MQERESERESEEWGPEGRRARSRARARERECASARVLSPCVLPGARTPASCLSAVVLPELSRPSIRMRCSCGPLFRVLSRLSRPLRGVSGRKMSLPLS
eukprot:scaffold118821_cov35-Tisochrysis_lutea.AAC.1